MGATLDFSGKSKEERQMKIIGNVADNDMVHFSPCNLDHRYFL